jgi:hypothetical protein
VLWGAEMEAKEEEEKGEMSEAALEKRLVEDIW